MGAPPLTSSPPAASGFAPQEIERRLDRSTLFAARLQLFVAGALLWLIWVLATVPKGIQLLVPTLFLGAWLVTLTLLLNFLAWRGGPGFTTGPWPGRLALLATLFSVILAMPLMRDTTSDFYPLYLFPIAVAAIYYGWRGGLVFSVLSALLYVGVTQGLNPLPPIAEMSPLWVGRILFLWAFGLVVGVAAQGFSALIRELSFAYRAMDTTTGALETAQSSLERQMNEAQTLERVAREFTATLDAENVLRVVLEQVEAILHCEAVTLMTLDVLTNDLVFRIPLGDRGAQLQGYRLPVGKGIAGLVAQKGEPLRVDNTAQDTRHFQSVDQESGFKTRSILCVPMKLQDRVTGVIEVMNKKDGAFTAQDENLLISIARWAAIAMENARLYQDLRQSIEELKKAQDQLVRTERLRALGEMAGGVAHDFNNLLTIILAEAQTLGVTITDPRDLVSVQRIEHAARDAAEAVRRLQEYTRVRRDLPREIVEVDEIIYLSLEITRPRWYAVAELDLQVQPVGAVLGNPAELREVLTNLLFNAIEARVEGHPCRLTIRTQREEGTWVNILVEDNGSGISPEALPHIFDPYFTTKPHGTGLGLSVVYGIITRHGGEIRVTSPLQTGIAGEGGTRFEIRLPLASRSSTGPNDDKQVPSNRFRRVLFVDDDANVLEAAASLMSGGGYQVTPARTAAEAYEGLARGDFDIMMTDLAMPQCSGWELARHAKQLFPEKPVILVTGCGLLLEPEEVDTGTVDAILTKPFTLDDLNLVLNSLTAAPHTGARSPN